MGAWISSNEIFKKLKLHERLFGRNIHGPIGLKVTIKLSPYASDAIPNFYRTLLFNIINIQFLMAIPVVVIVVFVRWNTREARAHLSTTHGKKASPLTALDILYLLDINLNGLLFKTNVEGQSVFVPRRHRILVLHGQVEGFLRAS